MFDDMRNINIVDHTVVIGKIVTSHIVFFTIFCKFPLRSIIVITVNVQTDEAFKFVIAGANVEVESTSIRPAFLAMDNNIISNHMKEVTQDMSC